MALLTLSSPHTRAEKLDSVDALEKALNKQLEKLAAFEAQTSTTGEV